VNATEDRVDRLAVLCASAYTTPKGPYLERAALVVARPYSHRPPRSTYELTAEGRALAGAVRLLSEWGARHSGEEEQVRHAVCGTPLQVRWYCPTCDQTVDEDAAEGLHYA